jgi:hypothetical protein
MRFSDITPIHLARLQWWSICLILCWQFIGLGSSNAIAQGQEQLSPEDVAFFENKIRPLLSQHCFECHSAKSSKLKASLMLDSRARVIKGGETGAAIVPFKPDESLLISAIHYRSMEMPPKGKLAKEEIENLERWVKIGAPWPNEPEPTDAARLINFDLAARKASHWAWQPVREPTLPSVNDTRWAKQPLDRFVLAKLEQSDLKPAPPIDRFGLIRRLSFDLLGLPPDPSTVRAFAEDNSSDAIEKLIDAMLRSPRFGEHWGRHWLDLVRYAESRGHEFDADAPNAYQYRDYIIRAMNADVPYNQLVLEHVAGDLLDQPRLDPAGKINESILGTGFWFLGEWVHSPVDIRKDETDRFDNMIDVMSKTFLGLTVSCARCHDHKFDAISSRDYYALSGFLQGSHYRQARFETIELERRMARELVAVDQLHATRIRSQLIQLWKTHQQEILATISSDEEESKRSLPEWKPDCLPNLGESTDDSVLVVDYRLVAETPLIQDGWIFNTVDLGRLLPTNSIEQGTLEPQFLTHVAVRNDPFWHGLIAKRESPTNLRSRIESIPRAGRTLITPSFDVTHGNVACLVKGKGHVVACVDSHRLVEGPLHGETIQELKVAEDRFDWVSMNLSRYKGHRIHLEFTPAPDQMIEIIGVRDSISSKTNEPCEPRLDNPSGVGKALSVAFESLTILQRGDDRDGRNYDAINWFLRNRKSIFRETPELVRSLEVEIDAWQANRIKLRSQLPNESRVAIAMVDGTGEDDRVLIRGNASSPGELVPRRFLEAIDGDQPLCSGRESGRLQLAERIISRSNPLTSRVIVNRVWHHMLGRGIVPTVDDFGALGLPPSHPELLDHLACWFDQNGRSIKGLIRLIASSQTYQMASIASAESLAKDPKNVLLQHAAPKRLSGEAIRDSLLSVAGELDLTMYGESIPIHLTSFMDGRGKPGKSGPLNGAKRRSVYIAVRRNFLSPFMLTFDTPNPFSTMGRRNVSNVPAQALILMNDPLVIEMAKQWASRELSTGTYSEEEHIGRMVWQAFSRPPSDKEKQIANRFLVEQAEARHVDKLNVDLWSDFAHSLINLKEFVFLR